MSAGKCVGGYSDQQLLSRINGMESYSKAALSLFRLLFKEEEYIGRSLTGSKSRSGEAKPAVDQDRLGRIYNVIAQKFPHITPVMVRERLRDLVKPSRTKRH
ncbi:uncharacterized protein LOC128555784 [Mercenaria mercenaria]|uniref:uncharacterized protein LOC128555784 n=1 Tax=Mercenaria mercenaria TaxID=6596 RepID=UPI001E1D60ED|nr:uncharacterized protein LOC128555784 [Mercenaria mercenaria]